MNGWVAGGGLVDRWGWMGRQMRVDGWVDEGGWVGR